LLWQTAIEERRPLAVEELVRATEVALTLARGEPDYNRIEGEIGHIIGTVYMHENRLNDAEQRLRQVLTRPRTPHRMSATANNLGLVLIYLSRLDEARKSLDLSRSYDRLEYGDSEPYFGDYALNIGLTYHWQGDLATAESWYRKALTNSIEHEGPRKGNPLFKLYLGHVLVDRGQWQEAQAILEEAYAGYVAKVGEDAEFTRHVRMQRARLALGRGDLVTARAEIDAAQAARARTGAADHLSVGYTDSEVVSAEISIAEGKLDAAEAALRAAMPRYLQLYGPTGLLVAEPQLAFARLSLARHSYPDAIATADRVLELLQRGNSVANDPRRAEALFLRAQAQVAREGATPTSTEAARQALAIWQAMAPSHPRIAEVKAFLAKYAR
jgi:tetratricopeptide (TPR) repeat protein